MIKLGKGFADELEERRVSKGRLRDFGQDEEAPTTNTGLVKSRITVLTILLTVFFLIATFRTYDLMVAEGKKNREIADNNRIKLISIPAGRGIIYDRKGKPLARNTTVYLRIREEKSNNGNVNNSSNPVTSEQISQAEALRIEEKGGKEAQKIIKKTVREYVYRKVFSHVLGYLTEVTEKELKRSKVKSYNLGDKKGRVGLEEYYEDTLRGIDGKELVEVDALGIVSKHLGKKEPISGRDLHTTLDLKLQTLIAKHFPESEKGAVVASDPVTGEILALYSSPGFEPALFEGGGQGSQGGWGKDEQLRQLLSDARGPLFNRAIAGTYPSGSTFKIVTAAVGLESGKINKDTEIEDVGIIQIGPFKFPNWYFLQYGKKEGMVDVMKALKRSNDIFFYKVGEMTGIEELVKMAKRFGFAKKNGIDLPGEAKGLIPDEDWKQKFIGDNWYLGDTYHLAIGQGYLLVTPLQVNIMTGVIASGGKLCRPHLLSHLGNLGYLGNLNCQDVGLKAETVKLIKQGMKEACSDGGTGWPFFQFSIPQRVEVGCKTGTAEFGDPQNRTHAWFTVFAPFDNPKIAMTVLVEGAGEGSNIAAPVVKKVLEEWL